MPSDCVDYSRPSQGPRRGQNAAICTGRGGFRARQSECEPQHLSLARPGMDEGRGSACRGDAKGEGGPFGDGRSALWGLPISVKDCFDLAGAPTTCGVQFYRDLNGSAAQDSWLVERLRAAGAVITGKDAPASPGLWHHGRESGVWRLRAARQSRRTDGRIVLGCGGKRAGGFGRCRDRHRHRRLGACAGSAVRAGRLSRYSWAAAIGAARGHLAQSFDTMGWLFRDLEDAPLLAESFAPEQVEAARAPFTRFARDRRELSARLRAGHCRRACIPRPTNWRRSGFVAGHVRSGAGGLDRSRSLRRSRRGKRRGFTPATSISFSPRFASGWSGAHASPMLKSPHCAQRHAEFNARMDASVRRA